VSGKLLAAILGLLVLGALLLRGGGRGAAWAPFPQAPTRTGVVAPRPRLPRPEATPREPSRNIFQYAEGATTGPASGPPAPLMGPRTAPAASPAAPAVATPAPVRVAGLIRRGGDLKAAIIVDGEMTLAGKGERAGGYTVLEVNDETGVRVRDADGKETLLPPPAF
jgi:hypothetical protein